MKKMVCFCIIAAIVLLTGCINILNLRENRKGILTQEILSEDKTKVLKIYEGPPKEGIMVDDGVVGEIVNLKNNKTKMIFYEYHCDKAEALWIDSKHVCINGKILNIEKDFYEGTEGEDTTWPNVVKGELINSELSPDGKYKANVYYGIATNSLIKENSVSIEIENMQTGFKRNAYYSYGELQVNLSWVDNHTLSINDKVIQIAKKK